MLYKYLFRYKKKVFFALFCILIANLSSLSIPWGIKIIIDKVLISKKINLLMPIIFILIFITGFRFYFNYRRKYLAWFIGESIAYDIRQKIFCHIMKLPLTFHDKHLSGTIISKAMGDVDVVRNFLADGILEFIYSLFNVLCIYVILCFLDIKIVMVISCVLPIFFFIYFKYIPVLKKNNRLIRDIYGKLTQKIINILKGIKYIKVLNSFNIESDYFKKTYAVFFNKTMKTYRLSIYLWSITEMLTLFGIVVFLWIGSVRVINNELTLGGFLACYAYIGMMFFPIVSIVALNNYYQEASASFERIQGILNTPIEANKGEIVLTDSFKSIIFDKVNFYYSNKQYVLKNISFSIKKGEKIGIVGVTGSGKSSIINLLLRFYKPQSGNIYIDGYNIRDIKLESLRDSIAVVMQDLFLFNGTIKENIAYGNPGCDFNDIVRAAKLANAHGFIEKLENGYNYLIGENGEGLSGGQKKLIVIARTFLLDKKVIILDEPTSSVDIKTESLLMDAVNKLSYGRILIIISHSLTAIIKLDKLIVVKDGNIEQIGTHKYLLGKSETYAEFFKTQANSLSASFKN